MKRTYTTCAWTQRIHTVVPAQQQMHALILVLNAFPVVFHPPLPPLPALTRVQQKIPAEVHGASRPEQLAKPVADMVAFDPTVNGTVPHEPACAIVRQSV